MSGQSLRSDADRTSRRAPPDLMARCATTLEADVRSLRQVPMFCGIDLPKLKLLAFTSERIRFAAGQRFFSQGDPSDAAYVVLDGRALVLVDMPEGEVAVANLGPGALVGEMGVLGDRARSATVLAVEPTTVLQTDRCVLLELMAQFPQIASAITRELATRLERTNIESSLENRSWSGLLRSAEIEAFMRSQGDGTRVMQSLITGWADPVL